MQQNLNSSTLFIICMDTVQNDTGANRNVTRIKSSMMAYKEIEPFLIGGVKADNVAIACIGKSLLPWLSKEGKVTLVETLDCAEVEGIIMSPTKIVQQHTYVYQRFTIIANVDEGTGILKFVHRDGFQHVTYAMKLVNEL